jgi:hypothetical protein
MQLDKKKGFFDFDYQFELIDGGFFDKCNLLNLNIGDVFNSRININCFTHFTHEVKQGFIDTFTVNKKTHCFISAISKCGNVMIAYRFQIPNSDY